MGLYRRRESKIWWMSFTVGNRRYCQSTGTDNRELAQKIYAILKGKIALDQWHPEAIKEEKREYTFAELFQKYKEWAEGRQRSWKASRGYMAGQLNRHFGKYLLNTFNAGLIEQYQSAGLKRGLKPGGVNRLVGLLKSMFTKASDWEMISEDVLKRVRKVKAIKGEQKRLRYLTIEECRALIDACDPHLKPIVITALNTGMRRQEILSLEWDKHVDLKHGFVLLEKTKTGERREIPINRTLRATLQSIPRRLDNPYVFLNSTTGKPYGEVKRSFSSALRKTEVERCAKCDYQRASNKNQKNITPCPQCSSEVVVVKGIHDFRFHDLRHTFASHLVMSGVDITTVSKLLGHKSLTMTLRYSHLAPNHLSNAMVIYDRIFNGPSPVKEPSATFLLQSGQRVRRHTT